MHSKSCLGVIPVRMKSTRLPGKPLKDISGKSLVQRVWEQARQASCVSQVVIATEDPEIMSAAHQCGAEAIMTKSTHATGSDRVAEVMQIFSARGQHFDLIANIQGDMPFIKPEVIDQTIKTLIEADNSFGMSTVATPIMNQEEFLRPAAVKVVLGNDNSALYFSRAPIPFWREPENIHITVDQPCAYKHMGLYVFRPKALEQITQLPSCLPEQREKLEQLRALCGGIRIRCAIVSQELVQPSIEVDTEDDLERARAVSRR